MKRLSDISLALALVTALAPLFLILILALRRDGGPAIYVHERVGRGGRRFGCFKFRSMHIDANERLAFLLQRDPVARREWKTRRKLTSDPRITPFGRFMRKSSLDELPQLLNIIRGEMSFVGPRPVTLEELDCYGHRRRHYLRCIPGVTGLWQVSGRSKTSYNRRVALDCWYAHHKSPFVDIAILFRTVPVVLVQDGAL